jgi:hypothetical protein
LGWTDGRDVRMDHRWGRGDFRFFRGGPERGDRVSACGEPI